MKVLLTLVVFIVFSGLKAKDKPNVIIDTNYHVIARKA